MKNCSSLCLFFAFLTIFATQSSYAKSYSPEAPLTFVDSTDHSITIAAPPQRVVSLVPSITEMLVKIGATDHILGVTSSATPTPDINSKAIMGSFLSPDIEQIQALNPDIIFYSDLHKDLVKEYKGKAQLVCLKQKSIEQGFSHIKLLGKIFNKTRKAKSLVQNQKTRIQVILDKVSKIQKQDKPRTIRIMGRLGVQITAPGDDSFQNEFIKAAGGLPPQFDKSGDVIPITLKQWQDFNPEVIYGCGKREELLSLLKGDGWRDVSAVQHNRIFTFPCELTCRASTNMGGFISTLSARLHNDYFSDLENLVAEEQIQSRSSLDIPLSYVQKAEIIDSSIYDFINKTLLLSFAQPVTVLSSLEGWRDNIVHVGNHYFPPPTWGLGHNQGVAFLRKHTLKVLDLEDDSTALLFTGADMDNLSVIEKRYKDMQVIALVTAGVSGNAVRMSADTGNYYELTGLEKPKKPGTINILLLTNTKLSHRAMTRAIISATEAKTAALYDLDIRSSYSAIDNPATGTGTDNIIVIQGEGVPIDSSGGHTKMGELIAKAVHDGVIEAIGKQNGFTASRSVFRRLKERKIDIYTVTKLFESTENYSVELHKLLLNPKYSGFIEEAMVLSDARKRGLITDGSSFFNHCQSVATEIAKKNAPVKPVDGPSLTPTMSQAFGALLSGIEMREM